MPRQRQASAKNTKQPAKARSRDREVLDTAAAVFARRGYASATVQDVADELGILKGSIYYYIKTKEDLLFRVLTEVHDNVDAILEEVRAMGDLDALGRLQAYIHMQVMQNLRDLIKIAVYYNDINQLESERREIVLERQKAHSDYITALIQEAQDEGTVTRDHEARILAQTIFGGIIWPYRWYRPGGRFSAKEVADTCVDVLTLGLIPR